MQHVTTSQLDGYDLEMFKLLMGTSLLEINLNVLVLFFQYVMVLKCADFYVCIIRWYKLIQKKW